MPVVLTMLLLVLALVLFVLAAVGVASRWNLIAAGLACWVLVQLLALVWRT
jgi:hypothetical protein